MMSQKLSSFEKKIKRDNGGAPTHFNPYACRIITPTLLFSGQDIYVNINEKRVSMKYFE